MKYENFSDKGGRLLHSDLKQNNQIFDLIDFFK